MPATLGNKVLYYLCLWAYRRLEYINRNCRWPGILLTKWFWDLIIFWNAFQTIKHWIVLVVYMLSVYYRVIYIVILIISFGIHRNSQLGLWLTWMPYSLILSVNRKSLYFVVWSFKTDFLGKRRLVGVFADRGGAPTKVLWCSKFQSFAFNFPEICPLLGSPQWREHLNLETSLGKRRV